MADIEITDHAVGDAFDIERAVTNIPTGATLTKAWLMAKINRTDADEDAVITKTITTVVADDGQITADGSGDTAGEIVFQIRSADTATLTPEKPYYYGIRVLLSSELVDTLEWGVITFKHAIVQATS